METHGNNNSKKIAAGLTALLFASLIGLLFMFESNKSLSELVDETRLGSERLLSEKLLLDKEISGLKTQISSLKGKNNELDQFLTDANAKLDKKEKELKSIAWDKAKSKKLEKELADLRKLKSDLDKHVASLNGTIKDLRDQNETLSASIASLQMENKNILADNDLLRAMSANNYRIDATKGKTDRLTAVARRTKKLTMGFDVPQNIVEKIKFKITMPGGAVAQTEEDGLSYTVSDNSGDLMASVAPVNGQFEITKRIEMTYKPDKKLARGVYKIDIYNADTYMGSCQVRLR